MMDPLSLLSGAFGALINAQIAPLHYFYVNSEVHKVDAELFDLQEKVTVTVPALNEEKYLEEWALASLREQNIVRARPDMFEILVVDSYSKDGTRFLSTLGADKYMMAAKGLLNARSAATEAASGSIVLNANADVFYPPNYINTLLKPYADPEVVAVGGIGVIQGLLEIPSIIFCMSHPKPWLMGSVSSFRKSAYEEIGGFDLSIDQSDYGQVIWAEEQDFAKRLAEVGRYVFEPRAMAYISPRRFVGEEIHGSF